MTPPPTASNATPKRLVTVIQRKVARMWRPGHKHTTSKAPKKLQPRPSQSGPDREAAVD